MADPAQQELWTQEMNHALASTRKDSVPLEHHLWGLEQRLELLRNLAAHAFSGGQPLVAASIYQQIGELEERVELLRKNLRYPQSLIREP